MTEFRLRPVKIEDAAEFNAYRRRISDEPNNFVGRSQGEYTRTVDEERERIRRAIDNPDHLILVVEAKKAIIGSGQYRGVSSPSVRHVVGLGIDVDKAYRGQGIGKALMQAMIDWARFHPVICRIELDVFAHNHRAISLYLKQGFIIEGLKRRAYYKYGQWVDAYLMSLIIDKD